MASYWSDKDKEMVLELWKQGETAAGIARALGDGRTRNSISGLLHRMNLKRDISRVQSEPKKRVFHPETIKQTIKPKENFFTPIEEVPPPEGGVPYLQTRRLECKYILNTNSDPRNVKCCGGTVYRESSWCRHHYNEVFTARIDREKPAYRLSFGKIQAASRLQFRRT
jgi:hypothetical protein